MQHILYMIQSDSEEGDFNSLKAPLGESLGQSLILQERKDHRKTFKETLETVL